ncbi:hypothetical protein [Bradyrhizobium sp. LTSP885]|uniref:hypothetical protein n=1 Tax=Bradyrhizobium sp. LTSP885 TaxID=1619232 RepID=UPI0012E06743|nr:hypothetical protein [Bradyrhizobium sp. LTSP885]
MKLLVGTKAIEDALMSIHRRGQTLQADIHVAACSVLQHLGQHSDIRIVAKLLNAMPEMGRKNAMRDWFVEYGPVMFDGDQPVFMQGGKVRLGDAMANPFWKFSPEKPYEAIDVAALIASTIKKLQKDEKEAKANHGSLIAGLEKLIPAAPTTH